MPSKKGKRNFSSRTMLTADEARKRATAGLAKGTGHHGSGGSHSTTREPRTQSDPRIARELDTTTNVSRHPADRSSPKGY